jgi:hypothetical protein
MAVRHLSDDEIQAHLDGKAGRLDPDLRDHLGTCRTCQEAVEAYRALYVALADDRGFEAPPVLGERVIAGLNLKPPRRAVSLPADIVLVAGAVVCLVVIALSFLDLSPITGAFSAIRSPLESARDLVDGLNHTLTPAVAGLAILAFMGVLDLAFHRKLVR